MRKLLTGSILIPAICASWQAHAFKFDTPDDWAVRWDNTVIGNLMVRAENQDPSIYSPLRTEPALQRN